MKLTLGQKIAELESHGWKFKADRRPRWEVFKFGVPGTSFRFELGVWYDERVWLITEGTFVDQWLNKRQVLGLYRNFMKYLKTGEV